MNQEQALIKTSELGPYAQHEFARFFAESD